MRERVWVVRPGDGTRLGDVLERAHEALGAVEDGRVFVGKHRALSIDRPVKVGDEIRIASPQASHGGELPRGRVLLDEDGIVAAEKPAGIPTIPDHEGNEVSLQHQIARQLGIKHTTLHPTSRLDRSVSGVVLFARTLEARRRLAEAREEGRYGRRYGAIAQGIPSPDEGRWSWPIGCGQNPRQRRVHGREATDALTAYALVEEAAGYALLRLEPVTGRTHQLRVHASHAGVPLLGDHAYGGPRRVVSPTGAVLSFFRVMLHAARVVVPRSSGGEVCVIAGFPDEMIAAWGALGGDRRAFGALLVSP